MKSRIEHLRTIVARLSAYKATPSGVLPTHAPDDLYEAIRESVDALASLSVSNATTSQKTSGASTPASARAQHPEGSAVPLGPEADVRTSVTSPLADRTPGESAVIPDPRPSEARACVICSGPVIDRGSSMFCSEQCFTTYQTVEPRPNGATPSVCSAHQYGCPPDCGVALRSGQRTPEALIEPGTFQVDAPPKEVDAFKTLLGDGTFGEAWFRCAQCGATGPGSGVDGTKHDRDCSPVGRWYTHVPKGTPRQRPGQPVPDPWGVLLGLLEDDDIDSINIDSREVTINYHGSEGATHFHTGGQTLDEAMARAAAKWTEVKS